MTDFACASCGSHRCRGECYFEVPEPSDEPTCIGCDKPFDASGYCAACEEHAPVPLLDLDAEKLRDPFGRVA